MLGKLGSKSWKKTDGSIKTPLSDFSIDDSSLITNSINMLKSQPKRRASFVSQSNFCKVVKKKKRKYINDYQIIKKLGQGSFSKVYLCQSSKGEYYAIKEMNKPSLKRLKMPNGLYGYDMIKKELRVLKQLDHENIIWL